MTLLILLVRGISFHVFFYVALYMYSTPPLKKKIVLTEKKVRRTKKQFLENENNIKKKAEAN